jgi:hypothetical protein
MCEMKSSGHHCVENSKTSPETMQNELCELMGVQIESWMRQ